jgi:PAS domain S-box-containing protein
MSGLRLPSPLWSLLPIPALLILIAVLQVAVEPTAFYDPPWLIVIGNTLFVGVVAFMVAAIAWRSYGATGKIPVLLLGCAMLVSGSAGILAAWVRGLPDGANLTVTIHNSGALVSGALHFAAALILSAGVTSETEPQRRVRWLNLGYAAGLTFMALLTAASMEGTFPPFFIQGVGPTPVRQLVLGGADWLFVFAFFMFLATYVRSRERFLYWYAGGLALTAINLTAVLLQHSVGSPVGWVGRGALYLGGIYFLVSLLVAGRDAQRRGTSFDDVLGAALTGAEERFRSAFTNAAVGFSMMTPAGRYVDANPAFCRLTGYSLAELRAPGFRLTASFDDHAAHLERIRQMLAGDIADFTIENRYARKGGQPISVRESVSLVRDPQGEPRWIVALVEDVTERKRTEEALRESEARYRLLHETMRDAFVQVSMDGRIVACNDIYCEMLGYAVDEVNALTYQQLTPERWHGFEEEIVRRQILPRGYSEVYEKEYRRKDGSIIPVELRTVLSRDASGRPSTMWAIVRDITERRKAEDERRHLQAELTRASRLTEIGRMAAALAHELNQPLTAVTSYIGGCRRLLRTDLGNEQRKQQLNDALVQANAQALRAGDIIRGLREFIGTSDSERTIEDAADVLREASTLAVIAAKHTGIAVNSDFDAHGRVLVDKTQIQQVVANLVRNAIEAMEAAPRQSIGIQLASKRDCIEFSISDTGSGIAPEIQDQLFKPFSTTKSHGMGIGLSVCREIVEAHAGKIWMEPNPEGGTIFRFTLPVVEDRGALDNLPSQIDDASPA